MIWSLTCAGNGCQPKSSETMLCQLARLFVERMTLPLASDTPGLAHEVVGERHVLDHLVRMDDVEVPVRKWERLAEAPPGDLDAALLRLLGDMRDELDPGDLVRAHPRGHVDREGSVAAAEVEQPAAPKLRHLFENHTAILFLGGTEDADQS